MTTDVHAIDDGGDHRALIPLRAAAIVALAAGAASLGSSAHGSLARAVATEGVLLDPASVRWLDVPSFRARRVMFVAQRPGGAPDVHVATVHTAPNDRVLRLDGLSNLTQSPDAAEDLLCASGRWAAFASRVDDQIAAVTLVDLAGVPSAQGASMGERIRAAVSRWQQTGRPRGYGINRYELLPAATRVRLSLEGDVLRIDADGATVRIDAGAQRVLSGAARVRHQPRLAGTTGWVTWLVDTVRAVPWIGPTPIAWAEHVAFGIQHEVARARVSIGTDRSSDEVAEDLADVLQGGPAARAEGRVESWPPARLNLLLSPALPHEGEWSAAASDDPFVSRNPGAPPAFFQSFVRTDRERPDTRVYVTLWDPRQVSLHVVPGSQEPMGATGETGTGTVPRDESTLLRLAAGFNGGFQALHGEWGVFAEGTLFLPPKPWGATITVFEDGRTGFGSWPGDRPQIPAEVSEFRQNLTSLVEDGVFNPFHRTFWGGNVPGAPAGESHTARTGLCITREDAVAFFWGEGLTERSLADAMLAARCSYGVHLDMNGANTGFEFLRVTRSTATPPLPRPLAANHEAQGTVPSAPGFTYRARRMVRGMDEMGFPRYIKRDPRDFFYLLMRPVLPGAPLRAVVQPAQPSEGQWHVAGLGDVPFPWPMARTRVRPDASQPERWVNLVRVDPRRVAMVPSDGSASLARVVEAPAAVPATRAIAWRELHGAGRWAIVDGAEGLAGAPLTAGSATTRGACVDGSGWLVYAVADRAAPDLVARALDLAGCGADRVALPSTTALALDATRDAAGAAVDPRALPRFALRVRAEPGALRVFPEVRPVPQRVWWDAQHRRVRYQRNDAGAVQVNTVGGRVTVPGWGPSRPPTPATPAP